MSLIKTFLAYAKDFELTFRDDDWSRLERYFAADAVYQVSDAPFACRIEGRDAIFRGIKKSIDGFDRRMDQRKIEALGQLTETANQVQVPWAVTYHYRDLPPMRVTARTTATYAGDRIVHLEDRYDPSDASLLGWRAFDPTLDPSYI